MLKYSRILIVVTAETNLFGTIDDYPFCDGSNNDKCVIKSSAYDDALD